MGESKAASLFADIDYRSLAKNIVEKRQKEGLGLREAAAQSGVSYSTLNRLERGTAKPDIDTLKSVLSWLGLSPSVLLMGQQPIRAHLRAAKNLSSEAASALADAARAAQSRFYKAKAENEDEVESRARSVRRRRPLVRREALAASFRRNIGYELDRPLDPFDLQVQGVKVARLGDVPDLSWETRNALLDFFYQSWSAITLPTNDREDEWLIVLNPNHSPERQRATLMEEYCHVLLGHELTNLTHVEGQTFRDYHAQNERDAYSLGAAILVPREPLVARVRRGENAETIAKFFGVSRQLVEYRIKMTGAWYEYKLQQDVRTKTQPSPGR